MAKTTYQQLQTSSLPEAKVASISSSCFGEFVSFDPIGFQQCRLPYNNILAVTKLINNLIRLQTFKALRILLQLLPIKRGD